MPTEVSNFTWSAFFGLIIVIINGSAFGYWIRTRPNMKKLDIDKEKLEIDKDETLLATTIERLTKLESALELQRTTYEAKIDQERVQHAAELAIMRHRMNNLDQCLTMLLMLIEQDPEKAREAASRVRQMRERQEAAEAAEKGAISAARIEAAGSKDGLRRSQDRSATS